MTLEIIFLLSKIHLIVSEEVETESRIFMRDIFAGDVFHVVLTWQKKAFCF